MGRMHRVFGVAVAGAGLGVAMLGGTGCAGGAGDEARAAGGEGITVRASTGAIPTDAGVAASGSVGVGDEAPGFALASADGRRFELDELLEEGPVVLTWYRGGWCPYCTRSLKAFDAEAAAIASRGATLVAISPETVGNATRTKGKDGIGFPILSDPGNEVARAYGVAFRLDDATQERYAGFGLDLSSYNGDDTWTLPIPATYVIDTDGTVSWAWLDPDYTQRAEPGAVLEALDSL